MHATVGAALARAGVELAALDAVACTAGPGLIGSLLVGVSFAKALAYRLGVPLIAVHHIEGHLASARLGDKPLAFPFLGFVVSGGHTQLYRVKTLASVELLGQTRDDSAGEAFDKVAKRLGLGYPGGREVDLAARRGRADRFDFPRPMLREPGLELSFSGLKTAVALEAAKLEASAGGTLAEPDVCDLCASFQEAAVEVLVEKARRALVATGLARLALVGGLAANARLRERMAELARELAIETHFPPMALCTDNAAMIGAVADGMLRAGEIAPLDLEAFSRIPAGATRAGPP